MADTYITYEADGVNKGPFTVPFEYISKEHVKVYVDGVEDVTFTWLSVSTIELSEVPPVGATILIRRETPRDKLETLIPNSGTFRGKDINAQSQQVLNVVAEAFDALITAMSNDFTDGQLDAQGRRIKNVGDPVAAGDAVNKAYADAIIEAAQAEVQAAVEARNAAQAAASDSSDSAQASAASAQAAAEAAQDAQEALAAAAAPVFPNIAAVQAYNPETPPTYVRVMGFYEAGDGGEAIYKRVQSEPSHPGKVHSADGTWWELAENVINPKMFGAKGDGVADDTVAFQNAALVYKALAREFWCPDGDYLLSQKIVFPIPAENQVNGAPPPPALRFGTRAVLKCTARVIGSLVEWGSADWQGIVRNGYVEGGVFDGNNLADHGFHVVFTNNCLLFNMQVKNTLSHGFKSGSVNAPQRSYGVIYDQCRTWRIGNKLAITNITRANPGVVTCATNHGFSTGDKITLSDVGGMTQVNNRTFTITVTSPTSFSIGENTSTYSAYTSGGLAYSGYAPENSVGIYFENTGDSHASNCMITGYHIGMSSNDGIYDGKFNNNHVWNFLFNGELLYGFDMAADNELAGCQVDGPFKYAYRFTGKRNSLHGCQVTYEPASYGGKDNYAYPIHIETGGGVVAIGCRWKSISTTERLAGAASGDLRDYSGRGNRLINVISREADEYVRGDMNGVLESIFVNKDTGADAQVSSELHTDAGVMYRAARSIAGGAAAAIDWTGNGGLYIMAGNSGSPIVLQTNYQDRLRVDAAGNVVVGNDFLPVEATDGFLHIPVVNGAPTGTPTYHYGRVPIVFDASSSQLCIYWGRWRKVAVN